MALVSTAPSVATKNPILGDEELQPADPPAEVQEDTNAVPAPDLMLVKVYGQKLMHLGPSMPLMPAVIVFFAMMNGYSRNDNFMPWELEARCEVDYDMPFFKACEEAYEAASGEGDSEDHCWAMFCHVGDSSVHTDRGLIGPDHRDKLAPWTEGQPCPSGFGQRCLRSGEVDPEDLEPLNVMYRGLAALGSLLIAGVSFSLRRVTAENGTLQLLGLGGVNISDSACQTLKRWEICLGVLIGFLSFNGVNITFFCCDVPLEGPMYWFVWPCAFCWYLALKEASVLVSDAVLEARKDTMSTSVLDEKWDKVVVPQILALAQKTLPDLSHGFGAGLFMCASGFWFFSASAFAASLRWTETEKLLSGLFRSFVLFCFPLVIALDVATASSDCDSLVTVLNDKRKQAMDVETDQKLQVLERALSLENAGQGMGFCVHGVVVDRKTLSRIFFLVMGAVGTVGPVIIALRPGTGPDLATSACSLTHDQKTAVQGVVSSWHNSSFCSYNITLNDIMAG